MIDNPIAASAIEKINAARKLANSYADSLDRFEALYDMLDPTNMTLLDAMAVFSQSAECFRHFRKAVLPPFRVVMDEAETALRLTAASQDEQSTSRAA